MNPILALNYETAIESLGTDYYDDVVAAEFPQQILRFRNDDLLVQLGLDPSQVSDADFLEAFGKFSNPSHPFLALRYHGYQFGEYNPGLGDGRGFLYGQVRGSDGELYDFGTKGSGRTPYSRGGDGMLTLKGRDGFGFMAGGRTITDAIFSNGKIQSIAHSVWHFRAVELSQASRFESEVIRPCN
jgi:serine/tyrosine/threonine adenylyltransferase